MKIEQQFPLVSGRVVKRSGDVVILNIGANRGVVRGSRLVVVEPAGAGKDMSAGAVRRYGEQFVQLEVERARPETGKARVRPRAAAGLIKEGDYVYAR